MLKWIDTEAVESPVSEVVNLLANSIARRDKHWFIDLEEFLLGQSESTLNTLFEYTAGYTDMCWTVLSDTLRTFIHNGRTLPDNTHLVPDGLSQDVFFLNLAFSLTPLAVRHHEPMIGQTVISYAGDDETVTEEEMLECASNSIYDVMDDLLPEEESIRIARACYLITLYGRRGEVPLPSASDFQWMSDHALEIMSLEEPVFIEGVFDRELAELLLDSEVPLRAGVL